MQSRAVAVQMERPHDYFFDPVYTVSGFQRGGGGGGGGGGTSIPGRILKLGAVSGANRFKYFKTPSVPTLRTVPPDVLLSIDHAPSKQIQHTVGPEPVAKTVGTQSDFRESEAQTDPFTPDYIQPDPNREQPELLELSELTWGRGLPAGVVEIEMIERARERRSFETRLPDIGEDPEAWRRMMEDKQMEEISRREAEIQALQEQRLQVIQAALESRDSESRFVNEQRMEELMERSAAVVEGNSARIHHLRVRELRKIAKARQKVGEAARGTKRDIIGDYSTFASKIYAPIKREGLRVDCDSYKFETRILENMNYSQVMELEASLPSKLTTVNVDRPQINKHASAAEARRAREMQAHLDKMTASINKKHLATSADDDDDLAEYRKAPVVVRPPTPELRAPVAENDEKRQGVIFLQRLLRGRALQNDMFRAREKRLELIKELRTVETLVDDTAEKERQALAQHQEQLLAGHIASGVGREAGAMLDYLNRELVRFKEERRIFAMVMLAERQRSMREAEEKGKRSEEETRRAKQDEMYRQVMQVHQGTVETYLASVLSDAVHSTAEKQSMVEANAKASFLNELIDDLDGSARTDEDMVRDMVSAFLLPEVSRDDLQTQVKAVQSSRLRAAHEELLGAVAAAGIAVPAGSADAPASAPAEAEGDAAEGVANAE